MKKILNINLGPFRPKLQRTSSFLKSVANYSEFWQATTHAQKKKKKNPTNILLQTEH
jgi:hypothetical protein